MTRQRFLEQRGHQVTVKWECQLKADLANNAEMATFFKTCEISDPISPRDPFYGGRTDAIKLYHKCTGNERIYYSDVCSLCSFYF
jgi:hypothetical protein